MDARLLARYDRPVPRYTSYPTTPHFNESIDSVVYSGWLSEIPADAAISLYLHIPFCDTLCWFCGCHTRVVNRHGSISAYLGLLRREAELVARAAAEPLHIRHLHFGGGSPDILPAADVRAQIDHLRGLFPFADDLEFAVEIDPRAVDHAKIQVWARSGANRASIGVQDFDPRVQHAINRQQSVDCTVRAVAALRAAGISRINIDLLYGLPLQTVASARETADRVVALDPDRIALFGYAHVPWMKPHQRLIDDKALPDAAQRWAQFEAVAEILGEAGYAWIGLDHFAKSDDPLALANATRKMRRNFQGYTVDGCDTLIGLGASAIGALPRGYVQNAVTLADYGRAIRAGRLPVARGIALSADDRRRRGIIERLMCDLRVDLSAQDPSNEFAPELERLHGMARDGLLNLDGPSIAVTTAGRPFLRSICAVFDRYLATGAGRHSRAV
jgi:oxygen-independent coproporphyrinogen-3 oxidase